MKIQTESKNDGFLEYSCSSSGKIEYVYQNGKKKSQKRQMPWQFKKTIYNGSQMHIPVEYWKQVIEKLHDAHQGRY